MHPAVVGRMRGVVQQLDTARARHRREHLQDRPRELVLCRPDALGARRDQVAKLTIFVVDHDMSKLEVLTSSVKAMFGTTLPAQTLVPVPKLAVDGMLFEVEAVAVID